MSLSLLLASALALSPSPQEPRATDTPPPTTAAGHLRLRKVRLAAQSADERALLLATGAVVAEYDYGAFQLFLVDEVAYGGRAALAAAGLPLRDDYDLVLFDGLTLDTQRPAATLLAMAPEERLGDPRSGALDPEAGLYLVQFVGPVREAWLAELRALDLEIVQSIPVNAAIVQAQPGVVGRLADFGATQAQVQFVGVYQPGFRMTPAIRRSALEDAGRPRLVTLQIVKGARERAALRDVTNLALEVRSVTRIGPYVNVLAELDPIYFHWLAAQPAIFAIEEAGTPARRDERQGQTTAGNVSGMSPTGPGYLAWLASHGFDGTQFGSFAVNVVDDATSLTGHADVPAGRVVFEENPTFQAGAQAGHGFLNAHIVAGFNDQSGTAFEDAAGFNYGLGIAPFARVGSTAIFGSGNLRPATYEAVAYGFGARISTNSWSFIDGNNDPIPDYDSNAQLFDFLVRDAQSAVAGNQEYAIVFSAGNDGATANTVSTPATAKNILTVGASENDRPTGTDGCGIPNSGADDVDDMIFFSSRGPVNAAGSDGRWKPEIVAPGTHVQAGIPQSNYAGGGTCNQFWPLGQTLYAWSSGTSHSTPAVAGGAALVYQDFLNSGLSAPSPAMLKAVLVNGSQYLIGAGGNDTLPSNTQGMGRMNLQRAFDDLLGVRLDQTVVFDQAGETHVISGSVADVLEPFRVTLVWTDAPGATTGAPWVNDLDLTVEVDGTTYLGNVFAGDSSTSGGTADFRNNTESVFLPAGSAGAFTVTVTASSIAGNGVPFTGDGTDQDFALVIYNASLAGAPTAQFSGAPTTGFVPLQVDFTDLSTGDVTGWAWDFGDTSSATTQDPSHTYASAGTYTVTLTVTGSSGSDVTTNVDFITVDPLPSPGISDGSFESQTPASAPASPWLPLFGSGHVVNPDGVSADGAMPTDGTNWGEVSALSSNASNPPSNPGGVTAPASGGAGFRQPFTYADGETMLRFEAVFLRNENANDPTFNDWMSVDVDDGTTTHNLFYRDTFSPTAGVSLKHGFAMTPVANVSADLSSLFPSSTSATLFMLTVQVGNAEDGTQPSGGYVDDFRLLPPAPNAAFAGAPLTGSAPLMVAFTDASTGGTIDSHDWDFGDGGTSSSQNPGHTYAAAGTYTVSLTVSGPGGGDTATLVDYVVVTEPPPVAAFAGTPLSGVTPLTTTFTDLSSGGPRSTWSWDFGDGATSTAQNPGHTYSAPGSYTVSLTVTGPGGGDTLTRSDYVVALEPAPIAIFSGSPQTGVAPLEVDFTDLSGGGAISSWSWDFGDATTSSAQHPGHTYGAAGSYTVSLTVTGPGGADTATQLDYVVVAEPAPVAAFSGTPLAGIAPLTVAFSDLSTGAITSWSWDFGDATSSSAESPQHTYTVPGIYTVSLVVSGPGGSDSTTLLDLVDVARGPFDFVADPPLDGGERQLSAQLVFALFQRALLAGRGF